MKNLLVLSLVVILIGDALCQHLEAYVFGKTLKKAARVKHKVKSKDKKAVKYGIEAAKKVVKGTAQGVVGKPLKLVGVALGPLGIPLKVVGKTLKTKSVVNKAKAGVKTVFKLSRHSVRYG